MVAVLVNIFGTENVELAEDVVQDALVNALETWKFLGIPDNPKAWLYRVAKNKAIDIIRRKKHSRNFDFSDPQKQLLTSEYTLVTTMENYWQESYISDEFLGLMYACCHPEISRENQITFTLKTLCGFSTREIARAFLTSEDTISKRIYRAREFFRKNKIRPEIPAAEEVVLRTSAVLGTIYLIFNEGYNSTHSDRLIREDLIFQSMHLCRSLLENKKTRLPEVYALMALMCFHASRNDSRLTPEGEVIVLSGQDRSTWNKEMITLANDYLNKAAFGEKITTYHLEAAIAYEHCVAKNFKDINWKAILGYYDTLLSISFDPVVCLNRCVAVLEWEGPAKAMEAIQELADNRQIHKYYLYHAVLGELYKRLGVKEKATQCFEKAIELTHSNQEKRFLKTKIDEL